LHVQSATTVAPGADDEFAGQVEQFACPVVFLNVPD
jgi:hypothetical protein